MRPPDIIFEFGAPGFWELVHEVRDAAFEAAARQQIPLTALAIAHHFRLDA